MHERKKKDGQRKDKKMERMREAVAERKEQAGPARPTRDEGDKITFKRGGEEDKSLKINRPPTQR